MKKFGIIFLIFWVFISATCLPVFAQADLSVNCSGIEAQSAVVDGAPITNASAAIVYELNSDTMMLAQNIDERIYPASFVKIMSAILALEKGDLEEKVTVTATALGSVSSSSSSAKLVAGETLKLCDLLYCMLTGSANDAAAVIAEHIGGTVQNFVALMNARAAELGCSNTNFVDPHGLQSRNQYTTARDMVRIMKAARRTEGFTEIFGALTYTVPATEKSAERVMKSSNYLIDPRQEAYYDRRVSGGRTGVAADRTRHVAVTAESGNMEVVAIVFGSQSQYAADNYTFEVYGGFKEISQMLSLTISKYAIGQVLYEGQIVAQRPVINGDNDLVLVPSETQTVVVPKDVDMNELTYRFDDEGKTYTAPIQSGSKQGKLEVWYGGKCLAEVELLAANRVMVSVPKEVNRNLTDSTLVTVIVVIITVLAVVIGIFGMIIHRRNVRYRKRAAARQRQRERERNR
ncbi:MAG: D-alanyl-D-alanine carboxypeptidase [Ruminococcaceae bacterium]|nr:D-alanyl-D-alanine carboxypeptidase [Oscillospiraceae bacterium]